MVKFVKIRFYIKGVVFISGLVITVLDPDESRPYLNRFTHRCTFDLVVITTKSLPLLIGRLCTIDLKGWYHRIEVLKENYLNSDWNVLN